MSSFKLFLLFAVNIIELLFYYLLTRTGYLAGVYSSSTMDSMES